VSGGLSAAKLGALDIIGFDACLMASYEAMAGIGEASLWRDFLASYYGTGTPTTATKPAANAKPVGPVFLVDENLGESDVQAEKTSNRVSWKVPGTGRFCSCAKENLRLKAT